MLQAIVRFLSNYYSYRKNYPGEQREEISDRMKEFADDFNVFIKKHEHALSSRLGYGQSQKNLLKAYGSLEGDNSIGIKYDFPVIDDAPHVVGYYLDIIPTDDSKVKILHEKFYWDIGHHMPVDLSLESYDHFFIKKYQTGGGVHFKFLPEKVQNEDQLRPYIQMLQDSQSAGHVRKGGQLFELVKQVEIDGLRKTNAKQFYYIDKFHSIGLGRDIYVYAHNCNLHDSII